MPYQADAIVIGGGPAGLTACIELLNANKSVILLELHGEDNLGGMANDAFGGMHLIDTPEQRKNGIKDNQELAWQEWENAAMYDAHDVTEKAWGKHYIENCRPEVYDWLKTLGIKYFPVVHWVERGDYGYQAGGGNSLPRYHMVWGTGWELGQTLKKAVLEHKNAANLQVYYEHEVTNFIQENSAIVGCRGRVRNKEFSAQAEHTIVCAGGINGCLKKVKKHWETETYGQFPENILSGCRPWANGKLHDAAQTQGAALRHMGRMWNYAAGVAHPEPDYADHGLSLIPPRSALWMDATGKRIGPMPMISAFDTHQLCKRLGHLPHQYGWLILNRKIVQKEVSISGSHINQIFKNKSWLGVIGMALRGNPKMWDYLIQSKDVVIADNLTNLVGKMNQLGLPESVCLENLERDVKNYDRQTKTPKAQVNDDQIRRLDLIRQWRGDKPRTLSRQAIEDGQLMAIRTRLLSRKSMGGIHIDLQGRALDEHGSPIKGLYAAGEASGFGGMSGQRSLEGTFLSGSIITAKAAVKSLTKG